MHSVYVNNTKSRAEIINLRF